MDVSFVKSMSLLLFLLNPFFMSIYLLGFFKSLEKDVFTKVLIRGSTIAFMVFCLFSLVGDRIFSDLLHSRFLSFQIFGGIIFLIIGIRMVFEGEEALNHWRENPEHISGAIAMPFFIGPGTVMASVVIGTQQPPGMAAVAIFTAVSVTVVSLVVLKGLYDHLSRKKEKLIQSYVNTMGRIMALVVGTFSIEMILNGLETWINGLK